MLKAGGEVFSKAISPLLKRGAQFVSDTPPEIQVATIKHMMAQVMEGKDHVDQGPFADLAAISQRAAQAAEAVRLTPEQLRAAAESNLPVDARAVSADEANKTRWFHGSRKGVEGELSSTFSKIEGLLGSGVYLTNDPITARSYAKSGTVYGVDVNVRNVVDMERPLPADVVDILKQALGSYHPSIASAIDDAAVSGKTGMQLWKDMANAIDEFSNSEMVPTSEFVDGFQAWENSMRAAGYDALSHVGGNRAGKGKRLHSVLILLDPRGEYGISGDAMQKTVSGLAEAKQAEADFSARIDQEVQRLSAKNQEDVEAVRRAELEKELAAARERGERISDEHAKQISAEQPELAIKLFTEETAELKQKLKTLTPDEQELVDAAIKPEELEKLEAITKLFGSTEGEAKAAAPMAEIEVPVMQMSGDRVVTGRVKMRPEAAKKALEGRRNILQSLLDCLGK